MKKIIECIPNFSEGKNKTVINKIADSIRKIKEVSLLDIHTDKDHNRSVMTFTGPPEKVCEAAFQAVKTASQLINLETHKGVHPRIGATDVLPLVPLKGITIKECVLLAKKLGEKIGKELKIPVYLYEKAATSKERKNLSNVRKKGYEKLKPDFGPRYAKAPGALALGVRDILIAYNVNLKSNNIEIAKTIAKKIREKNGGLEFLKALGLRLKTKKTVQVSMNLINYKKTSIIKAFKTVEKEAKKFKVKILESEIVGLIPKDSLSIHETKIIKLKKKQNLFLQY
jgi:glutamate formiminotransferase / 5-formyltetrahydrofolate cyclo-ligase